MKLWHGMYDDEAVEKIIIQLKGNAVYSITDGMIAAVIEYYEAKIGELNAVVDEFVRARLEEDARSKP